MLVVYVCMLAVWLLQPHCSVSFVHYTTCWSFSLLPLSRASYQLMNGGHGWWKVKQRAAQSLSLCSAESFACCLEARCLTLTCRNHWDPLYVLRSVCVWDLYPFQGLVRGFSESDVFCLLCASVSESLDLHVGMSELLRGECSTLNIISCLWSLLHNVHVVKLYVRP